MRQVILIALVLLSCDVIETIEISDVAVSEYNFDYDTIDFHGDQYVEVKHRGWDILIDPSYDYYKASTVNNLINVIDSLYAMGYNMDSAGLDNKLVVAWSIKAAEYYTLGIYHKEKETKHQAPDYRQGMIITPYGMDIFVFLHELGHSFHFRQGSSNRINKEMIEIAGSDWKEVFADTYAHYYLGRAGPLIDQLMDMFEYRRLY